MSDASSTAGIQFLRGGGVMAARIANHDWSRHPLGEPEQWPDELKTTLSIMLGSRFPMCLGWGADLLLFGAILYPDGRAPGPGDKPADDDTTLLAKH